MVIERHLPDEDSRGDLDFTLNDLEPDVHDARRTNRDLLVRWKERGIYKFLIDRLGFREWKIDDLWVGAGFPLIRCISACHNA
jgi:hypothetical protein